MNKCWIVGRLGQEPKVRSLQSGAKIMNFSVATSQRWTDKNGQKQEKTEWHNCVLFGGIVGHMETMLHKGTTVSIEGRLETEKYTDKNNVERQITRIRVGEIELLAGYGNQQGKPEGQQGGQRQPQGQQNDNQPDDSGGAGPTDW